ncbi:N4-gp56 family major capsid protein [Desulfosporosinus hippei]|uniref:Major capsid protein, N4-gp56 family n=1 Tax=Desulfosporosinus hippei DSM 8344 TaxID=1121419 RepID=A0A1G7UJ95_9FIRM|nr:N4-gp56 family major capsid protein [Desulfosporosinus hippei]SDG47625.1 major capsid protein, N4-gp56 family [Desulfosporosinus hippei DSM 8344]
MTYFDLQLFATDVQTLGNNGTGFTSIPNENAEIYDREMYDRLIPELQWYKYGAKKQLPKNSGDTVSIRRFENLSTSTTAITEGVIPDGTDLVVVKRSATVSEYGNYAITTEKLNMVGLDDTVSEVSKLMGENAGQSIDEIVRDVVVAGTNVQYANGVAARNLVAANISYADILKMARTMKVNKVKKIQMPDGAMGYVCMVDPYVAYDIKNLTEYKSFNQYDNSKILREGVIAKLAGIYFVEIDNGKVFTGAGASSADVHASYCLGRDAYMVPDIKGSSKPKIIVKAAGSAGTADPLDQKSSIGWKAMFATLRIDELSGLRFESLASA